MHPQLYIFFLVVGRLQYLEGYGLSDIKHTLDHNLALFAFPYLKQLRYRH